MRWLIVMASLAAPPRAPAARGLVSARSRAAAAPRSRVACSGRLRSLALLVALSACGTTRIHSADRDARIFVDGVLVGRGDAEITRRGLPGHTRITVEGRDGRRAETEVARSFTAATLVAGLFTGYVGLIAAWELPEVIAVDLPAGGGWEGPDPADDPWLR
jgi:hypothetical protein